jgi:glucose-1-phosphate thymidylyltransferase
MKAILLAGGEGTRLYPLTRVMSKQLLPVYDKPMIYYPLSVLMLGGIRDILVITTPEDQQRFRALLGDGTELGIRISYAAQDRPRGIADAFLVGAEFIDGDSVTLILGDNILYGHRLGDVFRGAMERNQGATIFAYSVSNPQRYGVVELDAAGRVRSLEEKPAAPRSSYAVVGLYVYDGSVVNMTRAATPSARGELEITDINRAYLARGALRAEILGRGYAWIDTGTHESMADAASYIRTIQDRQGLQIACLEEIALGMGYIDSARFRRLAEKAPRSSYGDYLRRIAEQRADS